MSEALQELPIVRLACFCENVIQSTDGVLSLIRIYDRFLIDEADIASVSREDPDILGPLPVHFVIMLDRAKGWVGHEIIVWGGEEGGEPAELSRIPIVQGTDNPGVNIIFQFGINARRVGRHRFELTLDGRTLLTRFLELQPRTEPQPNQ